MDGRTEYAYLDWLCCIVEDPCMPRKKSHRKLLARLFYTDFMFDNIMDANRASHGKHLRLEFLRDHGRFDEADDPATLDKPCSILEMIVALGLYIEQEIMSNPYYGDRTRHWIFMMLDSLELSCQTDDCYSDGYISSRIRIFLNKAYEPNGHGGLFTSKKNNEMLSKDIWSQACVVLNEVLENEEGIYYG